jgi:hypothetical protein
MAIVWHAHTSLMTARFWVHRAANRSRQRPFVLNRSLDCDQSDIFIQAVFRPVGPCRPVSLDDP